MSKPSTYIDLTGEVFGKWYVEGRSDPKRNSCGHSMWRCECECGNFSNVSGPDLRKGKSTQCRDCSNASMRKQTS